MKKNNEIELNISKQFSKYPGPRFRKEGEKSGEEFREEILEKLFDQCLENNKILLINLDGGAGYGTSFLEEAFGGLARKYKNTDLILEKLRFITKEEPYLEDDIIEYIKHANE